MFVKGIQSCWSLSDADKFMGALEDILRLLVGRRRHAGQAPLLGFARW